MRMPITPTLDTKDGLSNKNARLTNCLKEVKKSGEKAVVRPGLVLSDTYTGIGSGLIPFDGRLLTIFDDSIYADDDSLPWPLDSAEWSVSTLYDYGDAAWFNGALWLSVGDGNIGVTPGTSGVWRRSAKSVINIYDPVETYAVGDSVTYLETTYYSLAPSNTGNTPTSNPYKWSTTPTTSARFVGTIYGISTVSGSACASRSAAGYSAWEAYPYRSCATKYALTNAWITFDSINSTDYTGAPYYYAYAIVVLQAVDQPPYDCSNPFAGNPAPYGSVVQTA